jgi:EAL domain-containing protein (putative c-di-GMP-specific phosphodiesterase class I)/CRP-like cAMP-binding protein
MDSNSLHVKRKTFDVGDVVFQQGDIRDHAYIIEQGKIDIINRDKDNIETRVATLGTGDLFGEMALMEPGLRSGSAIATEKCVTYIISSSVLEDRLKDLDPVVTSLFSMLIERYRFSRIEKEFDGAAVGEKITSAIESPAGVTDFTARKNSALQELALEQEIRYALYKGDFKPYLQPIVSLEDQKILGFETLIRWHHETRGIIMPDDFIPIAERVNLIQAIDRKMLEMACDIIPQMHAAVSGEDKPFISVNLSGVNFADDSMVLGIADVLKAANVDGEHIKLEITESAFIGNADNAAKILEGLKELGVSIALDDFGVGYSSLGYLHRFAIDGIKIDKSFTHRARENQKGMDIVEAIIGLAKTFDLGVIAEGIETQDDLNTLSKIGCIDGQGYLFGRPLAVEDALKILH